MAKDGFEFELKWNVSDFSMTSLDVKKIMKETGTNSLPFYMFFHRGSTQKPSHGLHVYQRKFDI